ncbi:MAG: hypothetical protein LWW97_04560 [Deltaproteobacteria bacterium]|nr:hypothetical protein [Deltaproteobacteria bacterium]
MFAIDYKIDRVKFDHVWVEAYDEDEGSWNFFDPSYKVYEYTEGADVILSTDENTSDLMDAMSSDGNLFSFDFSAIEANLEAQADDLVEVAGDLTFDEILGTRKVSLATAPAASSALAAIILQMSVTGEYDSEYDLSGDGKVNSLDALMAINLPDVPKKDWAPTEEFSSAPDDMKSKMRVTLSEGIEYTTAISAISWKRLSIVSVAATDEDQVILNEYGLYDTPDPSVVSMKPTFQVDGEIVATGASIGLGKQQSIQVEFLRPGTDGKWESVEKTIKAGSRYNLTLRIQKTSIEGLREQLEELDGQTIGMDEDEPMTDDMLDRSLRVVGELYFCISDEIIEDFSKSIDVISVKGIALAFVESAVITMVDNSGAIVEIKRGGINIDIPWCSENPISLTGDSDVEVLWMTTASSIGSNLEHLVLETLYGIEAVSTGKIFSEAAKAEVPICILDDPATVEETLSTISATEDIKDSISFYVNNGYTVMIPQQEITLGDWTGQGWLVMEEDAKSLGYLIQGGLYGGWTTEIADNTVNILKTIAVKAAKTGDAIVIGHTMIISGCYKVVAGFMVRTAAVATGNAVAAAAGTVFAVGAVVLGTVLVCAGCAVFVGLLWNIYGSLLYIRRRYVYV